MDISLGEASLRILKKKSFVFPLGTQKNRLNETFLLRIKTCK